MDFLFIQELYAWNDVIIAIALYIAIVIIAIALYIAIIGALIYVVLKIRHRHCPFSEEVCQKCKQDNER